jgi:hypothetical protein
LAIEEAETFNAAAGKEGARVYRIFSFTAILERRRMANLTHVIRTGAVSFVDPRTGHKLLSNSSLLPDSSLSPDSSLRLAPGGSLPPGPGSNLSPSIKKDLKKRLRTSSLVGQALQATLGHTDDDAVGRIVTSCQLVCEDATEEEIVYFIRQHAPRFQRMKQIDNPMGMLIRHLPKCFVGEAFQTFRNLERQRREAETARQAEFHANQQRVLDDPESSEEDKQWARQILGLERS